jgi:hypothetical protein
VKVGSDIFREGFPVLIRIKSASKPLVRIAGVFLLFSAATAALFHPWLPHLHTALIGPPEDNMQDLWNTWYAAFAHRTGGFLFTDLIRFPEGTPLTYHSFAYPKVFAIALISRLLDLSPSSLVLQHNLSLLISFPLAGTGAFYLVRHFAANSVGALLGGYIFAFNPSHVEHVMHHAHVSSIEFIPLFVLAYLTAIGRKSFSWLFSAVVLFALNALSSWYYLFYVAYFVLFHTVYIAIRDSALPRGWRLLAPLSCLTGVAAMLSPLLIPMVKEALQGSPVYLSGHNKYVADLLAYFAFPQFHTFAFLSDGIYQRLTGNVWEATVYLGWINMAALSWLVFTRRQKDVGMLTYLLCGIGVFCVFASGSWLHIFGHNAIPTPNIVLSHLPFFKNVRTPSRAIVFVYLFLAIGVGYAAAVAWGNPRRLVSRWGVAVAAVFIILDFFPARPLPMTPLVCSPGLATIRDDPEMNFGVLDLPGEYYAGNLYMLQQTCHGRPIVDGNTSRKVVVSLRDRLETQDVYAQQRQLAEAKVKYIVVNRQPMGIPLKWDPANGLEISYLSFYAIVYDGPDLAVLRVY